MMSTLRDKMSDCLEGIAEQHEQASKRLGRDLAPIIAKELRDAERLMAQRCAESGGGNQGGQGGLVESQLDELAQCMQTEVVAPLHTRIRELTAQVQHLREEASQLERRWRNLDLAGRGSIGDSSSSAAGGVAGAIIHDSAAQEAAQVKEIERLFREAKAEDAFVTAMKHQATAKHVDFLGAACGLVALSGASCTEEWLEGDGGDGGEPLSMEVKMLLMLSLAKQLGDKGLKTTDEESKLKWIEELWLAFEPSDSSVAGNAAKLCVQLTEVLESAASDPGCSIADSLRRLTRSVKNAARLVEK